MSEQISGSDGLEVENDPGVWWCARHKNVKTRLRCGRCETPICPKCTVYGPTGARCRKCVSNRDSHMYQASTLNLAAAFGMSALLSVVGAVLISMTGIFLILLFAPAIGSMLGKIVVRVTGGKRGPVIASVASLGVLTGTAAVFALKWNAVRSAMRFPGAPPLDFVTAISLSNGLVLLAFVVLAISGVWWWLK